MSETEGVRLAKRVAAEQGCSRSQAEALITAGAVQVDGLTVTDPARRIQSQQALQVQALGAALRAGLTVLLHKPPGVSAAAALRTAWPALDMGPEPWRGLRELWPLPKSTSGLSVWSDEMPVLRRLADRERPLEVEWQLSLPMTASGPVLAALQAQRVRLSLGHEREGMGQWRVVCKGPALDLWLADPAVPGHEQPVWRRQRLGRLGLAPLAPGQARVRRDTEKF